MIGPLKFNPDPGSPLNGANAPYLEDLYHRYIDDPGSVDEQWRAYFKSLDRDVPAIIPSATEGPGGAPAPLSGAAAAKQAAVLRMINAYRVRGHQQANSDPLKFYERDEVRDLDPEFHGLTEADMAQDFDTGSLAIADRMRLGDILDAVKKIYCGSVGIEYYYITNTNKRRWLQAHIEPVLGDWSAPFPAETRRKLLEQLTAAEGIERYLHTRYVGQKRFSLEGGESLIPLLKEVIQFGGEKGIKEFVLGMAHRGRLNVLVNILGKSPEELFGEFEGKYNADELTVSGDVKYHQGFSSNIDTPGGPVHLALAFNPSHLEIVSPVAEGSVKARQLRRGDREGKTVLPVIVHGDAAFAGQGVVMETLNLSKTRGYGTGGTIHIIVNNQIGFTTSNPLDSRSTLYCTEVAKMVQAPIFHVNGDDPDAILFITRLALDYRMQFGKDVIIDVNCYRRHGHNEADEPRVTQPLMYKTITATRTTRELYAERLVAEGVIAADEPARMVAEYRQKLDDGEVVADNFLQDIENPYAVDWSSYISAKRDEEVETGVASETLRQLADQLQNVPEGFELHRRIVKIMEDRRQMADGKIPLDWGMAENLAYATLINEGYPIRISGQDSGRGTFFHRHATLHDQNSREVYVPLRNMYEGQPRFLVINSLLSEEAVLAFEYGYSTAEPSTLVIWEGQFGDFANGAQVVIDQFISSGETKWGRLCGLTLYLPHGYEGQGPEHSSARLERYLQLCADDNQQVCVPTTPAQFFHLIRRQAIRKFKRPLIVLTPKSLLRHKLSASPLRDLETGQFKLIIPETEALDPATVKRVVLCSGKVYFSLLEERQRRDIQDIAILRIEQLYPFPREALRSELAQFSKASEIFWCQEEPRNQGAWYQIQHHILACTRDTQSIHYAGRRPSPSPAAGYHSIHVKQQKQLVDEALSPVNA
ncbi:2-oxoglutarate dehydrogenase E1 component [Gammaproteobacteria bacterium]|nr:2-oxoglutarate dehydrogenase E1 component [Gammaproteobacteria bacterium]